MTQSDSTKPSSNKPAKPYPEFPFYAHAVGQWAKKIRGKVYYFGSWNDPQGALDKYLAQKDDLHAGRRPREEAELGATVNDLANAFWNAKHERLKSGELSPHSFADFERTTDLIVKHLGKGRSLADVRQDDFAKLRNSMAKRLGP